MGKKPNIEELEHKVEELEKEAIKRKLAEGALRESEQKFRNFLENLGDVAYETDSSGNVTYANKASEIITGMPLNSIIGKPFLPLFTKESQEIAIDVYQRTLNGESLEYELTFSNGRICSFKNEPLRDENANTIGVFGIARDMTERIRLQEALKKAHDELERRVEERTFELVKANDLLMREIEERKRAEEGLRETEQKFGTVSEQSPNMIFIHKKGKIVYANKACEEIMGYKRDEYYSSDFDFLCLVAPESVDRVQSAFKRHMDGKEVEPYEYALINKEGKRIEAIITTKLMNYEGERAILGIVTEISERKRMEQALRKSEESYRYLVENANDIIYKTDQTGHLTFFNPIAVKTTEYPPEYLLGRHYLDLIRPDYRKHAEKFYISQFQESNPSTYYEFPIITKSGKEIWLGQHVQLILENGHIVGFHAVARDITERRRVEEALRKSEERYVLATKAARVGVWDWNVQTNEFHLDQNIKASLGYSDAEIPNNLEVWSSYVHPDDKQPVMKAFQNHIDGKTPEFVYEHRMLHKDGSIRWIMARGIAIRDAQGNPIRVLGTDTDITERKRAEEALKAKEKELQLKTSNLEEANIALEVLLNKRDEDRKELEEKVKLNMKWMVLPYLEKMKKSGLNERQETYRDIVESLLKEITSPFVRKLASQDLNFTPTEIQVANLVKEGKTTKEVAELLNSSTRAVEFHRENLRTKLGLKNKKTNLRSYLLSLA
jgi:PAS domain S-box-containing protein